MPVYKSKPTAKWKAVIARNLNGERAQVLCDELGIKDPTFYTHRTRVLIEWRANGAPAGVVLPPESAAERRMLVRLGTGGTATRRTATRRAAPAAPAPAVMPELAAQVRNLLAENERLRDLYIDMAIRDYDRAHAST